MGKYLIVKCEALDDSWECDADRTPLFTTDNWIANCPQGPFEVWEEKEGRFELIKDYETPMESGMAFYYWEEDADPDIIPPTVIWKFPNHSKWEKIPRKVRDKLKKMTKKEENLNWGYISGYIDNNYYVYGEYRDNNYTKGY